MKRIGFLLLLLLIPCAPAAVAEEAVRVYQFTGATQCSEGTGMSLEEAADLLRGQGVKVVAAEMRRLPQDVAELCGAPSGQVNVMQVTAADWSAFVARNSDAGGYGIWVFDEQRVQVYKYDGSLQCGMGRAVSIEEMAKELETAGIDVVASRKDEDGLSHISVCGASTGAINVYVIDRRSLSAARRLGYRLLVTREMIRQIKPEISGSRQVGAAARSLPLVSDQHSGQGPVPLLW